MHDFVETPFHTGERAAQARAGVAPRIAAIRDWMPDQHRLFFASLPLIFAATTDGSGWPVATVLSGAPGFITSPDARTLRITALPLPDDPTTPWLKSGAPIGILGIDLATRRRNRLNGVIADGDGALTVAVKESFGNCPQYIHRRELAFAPVGRPAIETLDRLDLPTRNMIAAADTFFVASSDGAKRVDISHRGGRPGFVRVDGATLTVPDFAGNRYFNTLGNLLMDPRAALLFPDFVTGDLLQIEGRAEIVWDVPADERLAGADRLWRLTIARTWRRRGMLALRGALSALSPSVERTGIW